MFIDQIFSDLIHSNVKDITVDPYCVPPKKYTWLPPDTYVCKICKELKSREGVHQTVCSQCLAAKLERQTLPVEKICAVCGNLFNKPKQSKIRRCAVCKEAARQRNAESLKKRRVSDELYRKKINEQARLVYSRQCKRDGKEAKTLELRRAELLAYYATDPLKRCPRCGEEKNLSDFTKDKNRLSGRGIYCKICGNLRDSLRKKKRKQVDPFKVQAKIEAIQKAELLKPINDQVRKEKAKANKKKYKKINRQDPVKRMHRSMSECMRKMLRGTLRTGWRTKAGWTKDQVKEHLESMFQAGMSWDNYGEWHVDHIKPKALFSFKTTDDIGFKECWCLSNLQPLWAKDNAKKGAKYADP